MFALSGNAMSNKDIENLIKSLLTEVQSSPLDSATRDQLRDFETALEPYLYDAVSVGKEETILDKANQLEVAFAQRHPVAEGIMREIIDSLSRMGI